MVCYLSKQIMFADVAERKTYRWRVLTLLLWSSLLVRGRAQLCGAPSGTDFEREPTFWCSLHADIDISGSCTTQVAEIIHLPWAHGRLVRYIPHQTNQKVDNVRAFLMKEGLQTALNVSEQSVDSSNTNTVVTVRVEVTKEPLFILLDYVVFNGVEMYVACDSTKDVFQDEENTRYQLVKWGSGGKSAQEIRSLQATFSLDESADIAFVDSPVKSGEDFKVETVRDTPSASKQIVVRHSGNATSVKPATVLFYFRGVANRGTIGCPNSRSCERETSMVREKYVGDGLSKAILGIGIGLGVLATAVAIGLWVACCKSLTKKHHEKVNNLPISLRHFAYDTGDDKPSGPLRQWARGKNNVGKKEYLAIDLSPGNKAGSSEVATGLDDEIRPNA